MGALLVSEWRRFRAAACTAAAAHGVILALLAIEGGLFESAVAARFANVAYALAGLVLGIYQIASYRRGDLWIFLLHRPLAPRRIFGALAGAAALVLALAVAAPLALAAGVAALRGFDARHLLLPPWAWLCALAFYLVGCVVALTPWRGAFLVAAFAVVGVVPATLGGWSFAPLVAAVAALAIVAGGAMRPDLGTPPRARWSTALAALAVLHALFLALSFAMLFVYSASVAVAEEGWRSFARFGWNDYFPAGTYPRAGYLDAEQLLAHGLGLAPGAPGGDARPLAAAEVSPRVGRPARRHQPLFLDRDAVLVEAASPRRWTFRHDRMAFLGRDARRDATLGWLDAAGMPFEAVPFVADNRQVVTQRRLFGFDAGASRIALRFTLGDGERLAAPALEAEACDALLSDRALYLFRPGQLLDGEGPATPFAVVPFSGDIDNLDRAVVARRADGFLVSLLFGRRSERELREARQVVVRVSETGVSEVLVDAVLAPGLPAWARHRGFVVSPALQTVDDLVRSTLYGPGPRTGRLGELAAHPPPPAILALAILSTALAAALTWWLTGRRGLAARRRRAWLFAALCLGLPLPFALLLLTSRPS